MSGLRLPPPPPDDMAVLRAFRMAYRQAKRDWTRERGPTDGPAAAHFICPDGSLVEVIGGYADPDERARVFDAAAVLVAPVAACLVSEAYMTAVPTSGEEDPSSLLAAIERGEHPEVERGALRRRFAEGEVGTVREVIVSAYHRHNGPAMFVCDEVVVGDDGDLSFIERTPAAEPFGGIPELLALTVEVGASAAPRTEEERSIGVQLFAVAIGDQYAVSQYQVGP